MKGAADRTKVVLRHLPPTISQAMLIQQIDGRFGGRYNLVSFRSGINSQKHQTYSRAYINFQRPDDVIEFAYFFGGHVFVNEKGTRFKTIVEYAPSQRVPKHSSKKDGRAGTINKDPEYMEFLETIAKPVENLPSAEIQLERREAERAGAVKDSPIITPLMQFVRQKRAAKGGSRRSLAKSTRTGGLPSGSSSSVTIKRGSERRKVANPMYVLKDPAKSSSRKDRSTYITVPKQSDHQVSERSVLVGASGTEVVGEESGFPGNPEMGKKKILLLKGREKEISHAYGDFSLKHTAKSPIKKSVQVTALRQNQQQEASGKITKSILLNKDSHQSLSMPQPDKRNQVSYQKDKRVPRSPNAQSLLPDKNGDSTIPTEKLEKRTVIKGRPDRAVWTALHRSDGSHASNESLPSANSQHMQSLHVPTEGAQGDPKNDMSRSWDGELKHTASGRHLSVDNGSYKDGGRRRPPRSGKDTDGSLIIGEGKPSKRGASYEKQVWVQKSSSAS